MRKACQPNKEPHLKDLERLASVELEHLGQGGVERSVVGIELLPQHPLGSGLVEQALW
jgi:hypothetical protein